MEKHPLDGVMPNERTYRIIISGLCKGKDKDRLKKIVWEGIEEEVELDLTLSFKWFVFCLDMVKTVLRLDRSLGNGVETLMVLILP